MDEVRDCPGALEPGDVIVFRGEAGSIVHSAVIQSVDLERGVIRYLQSTDLAPPEEQGVHESFISFDPASPGLSIADPEVLWHQRVERASPQEPELPFRDDGERYRAGAGHPPGSVVRLRALHTGLHRLP